MSAVAAISSETSRSVVIRAEGPFPVFEEWPFDRTRVQWYRRVIVRDPEGVERVEIEASPLFDRGLAA